MIIELTNYTVKLKEFLTWGDKEEVKAVFIGGAQINSTGLSGYNGLAMFTAKLKLLEKSIVEIKEKGTDKTIPYSDEWAKGLSAEEGDKLYDQAELVSKKK